MKLVIDLGGASWLSKSKVLGLNLKLILESLTSVNQLFLRTHKVPPIYQSGVKYRPEPNTKLVVIAEEPGQVAQSFAERMSGRAEDFATVPAVLKRGWGDCDDLAPWLCAQRRNEGKRAKICVRWKRHRTGKVFHIVVLVRKKDDATGQWSWVEEDPSAVLGMYEPKWKNPALYM